MAKLVPDTVKKLESSEAAIALRGAYNTYMGKFPSDESLSILWAQSALETGRWKVIHCYNFGNIKKRYAIPKYNIEDDGHDWCMFRCNEVLNGKIHWFDPPHPQTHFRAYESAHDGAKDYIKFVANRDRYVKAWSALVKGDPELYAHELKVAGYYTASEKLYTKGVKRLFDEFMVKKSDLLSWPESSVYFEDPIENFLTDDEKNHIMGVIGMSISDSVYNYFASTDRIDA